MAGGQLVELYLCFFFFFMMVDRGAGKQGICIFCVFVFVFLFEFVFVFLRCDLGSNEG